MYRESFQEQGWGAGMTEESGAGKGQAARGECMNQTGDGNGMAWAALFDELAFGVAIVDARRRLLHASQAARAELGMRRGLRLASGVVEATLPRDSAALQKAIDGVQSGRRSYLAFGLDGGKSDIAVLPMPDTVPGGPVYSALVFEKSPQASGLGLYFFAQAYRLTRCEQRVLAALCDGLTVVDVAARLGCAVNTARTHVRNLLIKTGQQSLRALAGRIGMLPPVASRVAFGGPVHAEEPRVESPGARGLECEPA